MAARKDEGPGSRASGKGKCMKTGIVRDDYGRVIVSYTAVSAFRQCPRAFKHRYIDWLVPIALAIVDPRIFGSAFHESLEVLRLEGFSRAVEQALSLWNPALSHDHYQQQERHIAALNGYKRRWLEDDRQADSAWEIAGVEFGFTGDVVHPASGDVHRSFSVGGKCDLAVRIPSRAMWGEFEVEPGLYLGETKTWSRLDGNHFSRLWTDFQILFYSHYLQDGAGDAVRGVLYDVACKTNVEHDPGETPAEFDARVAKMSDRAEAGDLGRRLRRRQGKAGETEEEFAVRKAASKNPSRLKRKLPVLQESDEDFLERRRQAGRAEVAALQRRERESDESFRARLDRAYDGENMFHRELVPVDQSRIADVMTNLWDTLEQLEFSLRRDLWPQNEQSCFKYGRPCDYWLICESRGNPTVMDDNYRLKAPHSEHAPREVSK